MDTHIRSWRRWHSVEKHGEDGVWNLPLGREPKEEEEVTNAWTIVDAESLSSELRTRRSCRRWKKDLEQMWDTCLSRLRSDEMMTPSVISTRAWSVTVTVVVPSCMTGLLPPIMERLHFEPVQSSSVLSVFGLSRFAAIYRSMSLMHCCSRIIADGASSRWQCTYHCVSPANARCLTPCSSAIVRQNPPTGHFSRRAREKE